VSVSVPFGFSQVRRLAAGCRDDEPVSFPRGEFAEQAAEYTREILVSHARNQTIVRPRGSSSKLLDLHRALNALAAIEPRKSKAIELRHFAGLSAEQVADTLEIPVNTVRRDLRFAEAWLARELTKELTR